MSARGTLYGVGLGPGDPELLTVKAVKALQAAPVIACFAKAGRRGNARAIADPWISPAQTEVTLDYPVTTEIHFSDPEYISRLSSFYAEASAALARHLDAGRDVALLCEGDPFFYGSYMHMHERLKARYPIEVIPGVTGMSGCWTAAGLPMTWGDDILTVLPGTLPATELARRLGETDAAVVMKLGRNFPKVRAALCDAGLLERAVFVAYGTMEKQEVVPLAAKGDDEAPYFSMIVVPGNGRRP